ncbi:MAG: phosphotransferase, partial [Bacteroidota bacterium]
FPEYSARIHSLRNALVEENNTLCHGDFSPKNLLLHPNGMTLVDHETAHFGDFTMDLGLFLAHLVLKCIYAKSNRSSYAELVRSFLNTYQNHAGKCDLNVQQSALGHLGVVLLTRVSGTSQVDYLDKAQKQEARMLAQTLLKGDTNNWESFPPCSWLLLLFFYHGKLGRTINNHLRFVIVGRYLALYLNSFVVSVR